MKNSNLLNRLLSYSHEKQSPQRFARYAAILIMLLTLGVGQMWADAQFDAVYMVFDKNGTEDAYDFNYNSGHGDYLNGCTITTSLKVKKIYMKFRKYNGNVCMDNAYLGYNIGNGDQKVQPSWTWDSSDHWGSDGNQLKNESVNHTIASSTDPSGVYHLYMWWHLTGKLSSNSGCDYEWWMKNGGSTNYDWTYKILPPAVSGFTITPSGDGYVSGTGTESDPYIMKHDAGNLVLTMSGSQAHTDANSSAKYYNGSSWSTTATKTIYYANGSTTKQSITLKMKYNNSTASLDGAVSEKTVYYQRESTNTVSASAFPAAGGSVTPSSNTTTGQKSGIAISASNNTGYTFSGWSIVSGSGSFVSSTSTASNRFKPTSNTSLRATFTAKNYTVTLDKNDGDSNGSIQTTYNSSSISSFTGASRAGYSCDGYFTDPSTGSKVINADGTLVSGTVSGWLSSGNWVKDAATITLYAHWTEDITNYTVTYAVKSEQTSLGTLSCAKTIGGAAVSSGSEVASGTGVTFTASPITGYEVDAWCSNPACTTPIAGAGYANTYSTSVTADLGVYVKFKKKIYTITYSPSSAPTGCTYTTKPTTGTYGNTVTMVITPSTGYTVSVSARDASSNVVTISNPSANTYTFTQPASAVTVTVTATETMRTITINGGTSASTTAGVVTTGSATAAAPAAGKKFTGWTLGDGVSLSGGALTDKTINFTATQASSVTANYADRASVKMYFAKPTKLSWTKVYAYAYKSSDASVRNAAYPGVELENTEVINCVTYYTYQYYTEGDGIGGAATGNSAWNSIVFGDNNDTRKTVNLTISNGHYYYKTSTGTGETAALTSGWGIKCSKNGFGAPYLITHDCVNNKGTVDINLTGGQNYTFKVYDAINDQWWSNSTSHGSSTPITASMATASTVYDDANNMQVNAALTGDYTFEISATNAANPKIKVTFPEIYAIVGSFNSWNTETNPLSMDGNTGTANIVLAPSGSNYTLKVVDDGSMYGKNSTTITGSTTVSGLVVGQSDIALTADIYPASANPSYGFSYNKSTKALTVTYPAAHTVTYGVGTHAGTASVTSSISVASGKKILDSQSITFSKGDTKTGYTWKGWYNNEAGTGDALRTDDTYTSSSRAANTSVYACYDLVDYTITYDNMTGATNNPSNPATYTIEDLAVSLGNPSKTGYIFGSWKAKNSSGVTVTSIAKGSKLQDTTLWATWTPITYTIRFNGNGSTSGSMSNQTGIAYDAATTITANAFVKTGYNFAGWALSSGGDVVRADEEAHGNLSSTNGATVDLYAKWTAKQSTLSFDYQTGTTGHGADGSVTAASKAIYDAAMPALSGSLPTAATGYAFMGFYDATGGGGTKYYHADGSSARNWDKDTESGTTLYAYYKKAEITEITLSDAIVAPNTSITATPTISPTPTGTTGVCWELQYSNGTRVPSQPTFTPEEGNAVSFKAPAASATYILQAQLRLDDCNGDVLSTQTTTFQVAGEHTVTVHYQDASGMTLAASTEVTGKPLEWTAAAITAPTVTGYTFHHWLAGDGVTLSEDGTNAKTGVRPDSSGVSNIYIKAVYDGTLTAVYNKKNMIFFNNTLGWSDVYVYFYSSDKYWVEDHIEGQGCGTGSDQSYEVGGSAAYYRGYHGHMTQIEGTNIWYYDYEAEHGAKDGGEIKGYDDVVFVETEQNNHKFFYNNNAARRGDFKHSLPMFVPINSITETKNGTKYYSSGYWMNYPENTGYVLHVYDGTSYGTSDELQKIPFEFTEDMTLPMSINVELNAGKTYGFEIHRADDVVLGENSYTLQSGDSGDEGQTVKTLGESERSKITTAVAGDYKFTLNYGYSGSYTYLIGVHYPVVTGDYRILYTDDATWSKDAHSANYAWWHESRTIHKENGATDIVSFYVKKDNDTKMKFQKVSGINASTGAVTWADSTSGSINLSSISADGVYNFYLSQANGVITVDSIRPYTGNYYIRTDCAGATKWENFRTTDHQMTYSDYAEENSGYSHYYAHWVEQYTNIKFVIANDYSPCISDTLAADYGTTIANITAEGVEAGKLNSASANIRFMWNQSTNKISRAYIGGSSNISDRFLVLEGDTRMFDEDGDTLTTAGGGKITGLNDYEMNLVDDQNFVYERTIKVNTGAKAKLTAKYNNNIQYFKGGPGTTSADSVELLGGESSTTKHTMRIVYDFKTNRLMTAFVPSDTIKNAMAINADLMIVREHQEAGHQLLFNGGSLSEVHTVYGVMRFNRWTLNNKEKTGGHSVVGDPKSAYERGLYWISFPFDVNLSDVFGFGTYGTHWIIMEYDGAARATEGYWADSEGFWKYVMPAQRSTYTLESGKGYVLALDLDLMKDNNTSFWSNNIEQVELFFPSASYVSNIASTNVTTTVDSHECTIDRRTDKNSPDINKDRTRADSHWNIIGIPSYANYGSALKDGPTGSTIEWHTNPYTNDLPFLYEWSTVDNSYAVQSGTTYPFKAMHAYMVQYHGNLYWSLASATPVTPIVARSTYAEKPESVEMRLELQQNEMKVDQTFVKLSNDENASVNFAFDEDLCKEFNANKANIYTIVENYLPVAGNTMPMSEQTTVVPVGVRIAADGDYTFAIPDGTEGIGVTLIDNETGIRTSLSALEYTINLSAGDYADRFFLEISPISQISTDIEAVTGDGLQVTGARKIMIDGLLYIVKDGKLFDAQGRRL